MRVDWDQDIEGEFRVVLRVEAANKPGVLATVAAAMAETEANIENVEYGERDASSATMYFTLEVRDRQHLGEVMRRLRRLPVVQVVQRQ